MKIALVHYWLVGMRGGERVLESLCDLYPEADIFTLVVDYDRISDKIKSHKIIPSFLQSIGGKRHYQKMLPLMPYALEAFDLTPYDLIISSEAGPAKGIIPRPDALHICYCHSPMRYIWDVYPQYRADAGFVSKLALSYFAPKLRQWDVTTSARVDHFIANSKYVAARIRKYYRRDATVIHPPVNVSRFRGGLGGGDFYLCAGQITPYKKIDIAIEAFNKLGLPLVIIGGGYSRKMLRSAGPNIRFEGQVDDATMADYFSRCRALVFPGIEDFGIVPVEVMASGRPVIAYAAGGALETVVGDGERRTGLFFHEQTPEAIAAAVEQFEREGENIRSADCRAHAENFAPEVFRENIRRFVAAQSGGPGRFDNGPAL